MEKYKSYMKDIPKFIQELTKALHNDFNEIQTIVGTRRILKKHMGMSNTKMQNCMIDMHLEKIHATLFPEDINTADFVDVFFLDVSLKLLNDLIIAERWNVLLSKELQENLESLGDCIQANFKERQKMLKLLPPNTRVEVLSSKYTPLASVSTSKMTSTNTVPVAGGQKKSTISRQSVLIKKKITPQKKAIVKQVEPFQWRVQLREKKKVVQSKQNLSKKPHSKF